MQPEYILISERLVQEIVDRAAKPGVKIKGGQVGLPFAKADIGPTSPAANAHVLAKQAEDLLHDETGTIDVPGTYVGLRAHFDGWMFSFAEGQPSPVAWLSAEIEDNLVVLCGSARNVLGYSVPAQYPGWRPSTLGGLKEVVAAMRRRDPEKLIEYLGGETDQPEIAGDVTYINAGLKREGASEFSGEYDVLFRPFAYVEDFSRRDIVNGLNQFKRVIVGAPLWVRLASELHVPGSK